MGRLCFRAKTCFRKRHARHLPPGTHPWRRGGRAVFVKDMHITSLQAHILRGEVGEPLRRAVMRLVLLVCIAPAIAATGLRYVLLAAGRDPRQYLHKHACELLLPCLDHLSSLGRALFTLTEHYRPSGGELTDSNRLKAVRAALQAYEFKSTVFASMLDPKNQMHTVWFADSSGGDQLQAWTTGPGGSAPRKNRHGSQCLKHRLKGDKRLLAAGEAVIAAASGGSGALRACLVATPADGGAGSGTETLPAVRVPAVLASSTNACRARRPQPGQEAPPGGPGSSKARAQCLKELSSTLNAYVDQLRQTLNGGELTEAQELAAAVGSLSPDDLISELPLILSSEPSLLPGAVENVLGPGLLAWVPAVQATLPGAVSAEAAEMFWCDMAGRFRNSVRSGNNPHQMPKVSLRSGPNGFECFYSSGVALLPPTLTFPNSRWRPDDSSEVFAVNLTPLLPEASEQAPPDSGPLSREALTGSFSFRAPASSALTSGAPADAEQAQPSLKRKRVA